MEKDAYYFPHFSNARQDRKLRRVRKELGVEGYGIYFMILEVLRDQADFSYPLEDIDLLADEFRTSEQKVRVVICNYDLFEVTEEEFFYSPKFIEYLKPYLESKERNRLNGIKGNLIKYGHATKQQLSEMSKDEILRLNADKPDLVGGDSGGESRGDSGGDRNKSKVKESKVNKNIPVPAVAEDVPQVTDEETWQASTRVAESLLKAICEFDPTHKYTRNPPSLRGWVKEIDRGFRLDGRTEEQFEFIIDAVFFNCSKFPDLWDQWATNIESGKKLRDKFDQIKNQIKTSTSNGKSITNKIRETEQFLSSYQG